MDADSHLRVNKVSRRIALLTASCIASAFVVGGVGGRIVMRISAMAAGPEMIGRITENGNRVGEFTVFGTLFLVLLVGVLVGMFGSVIVVASDQWVKWMGPVQGLGFGLVALALIGQQENFGSTDFLILEPVGLNIAMFTALPLLWGFGVTGAYWLLDQKVPPAATTPQPLWMAASLPLLLGLVALSLFLLVPGFSGGTAAYEMAAILFVMTISAVTHAISSAYQSVPATVEKVARIAGYGSLALLLTVGLWGAVTEVRHLI
ncbi:MAG TPA: hypothetical protein VI193_11315 [Acidimicrobiia bacterium]